MQGEVCLAVCVKDAKGQRLLLGVTGNWNSDTSAPLSL